VDDGDSQVVQFSHFSVKEFLTSDRLECSSGDVSRYHIRLSPAHTILAQACLGVLLCMDEHVTEDNAYAIPLVEYAAKFWLEHAQFEDVSSRIQNVMEYFFDSDRPHWATWLRVYDMDVELDEFSPEMFVLDTVPLYYAARYGFYDLAEHLVVRNPEHVNAKSDQQGSPLVAALRGKHYKVAELLFGHGADIGVRGQWGFSLLHFVLWSSTVWPGMECVDVVQWLLDRGAEVNARDKDDLVPLYMAISKGYLDVCQILQDHNADLSCRTIDGETLLHQAASPHDDEHRDQLKIMQMLLDQGADCDARDDDGCTPLHYSSFRPAKPGDFSRTRGTVKGSRLLLEHGADIQAKDNKGKTPLQFALEDEHHEMAEFLSGMGAT